MLQLLGARADRLKGRLSERGIPGQVLRAVELAPVPVCVHDDADEMAVVDMGHIGVARVGGARLEGRTWRCKREADRYETDDDVELHPYQIFACLVFELSDCSGENLIDEISRRTGTVLLK